MTKELPKGFRIIEVCFGGTGHGDELFAPELQQWRTWVEREGLSRRKVQRTGWRSVERGSAFAPDFVNEATLLATALMLSESTDA